MIKKIFLVIISIFMLTGCTSATKEETIYKDYISYLQNNNSNLMDLPFNIEINVDKIVDSEVMYRVIIDNPKIPLRNIEALIIHDKYTSDVFPSTGIFEEKYNLIPNVINKSSNYVEGIILAGYIPFDEDIKEFHANFKLLFKYVDDDNISHSIVYSTEK